MATISVPDTRQYPLAAVATFTYEDLVGVVVVNLFALPVGSLITSIFAHVDTVFAATSTTDCEIGDATDDDEYSTTTLVLDAGGIPSANLVASGFITTADEPNVEMLPVSGSADPTSGQCTVFATYLVTTRANENYEA